MKTQDVSHAICDGMVLRSEGTIVYLVDAPAWVVNRGPREPIPVPFPLFEKMRDRHMIADLTEGMNGQRQGWRHAGLEAMNGCQFWVMMQ